MVRHIVLVRFRDDVPAAEIDAIFGDLDALQAVVPGMLSFAGGANVSPEGLSRGYGHAFTCDFTDSAARDAYLADSDHHAAGARLVAATHGGVEGLVVLDVALAAPTSKPALARTIAP